jgi:hypothetical protein
LLLFLVVGVMGLDSCCFTTAGWEGTVGATIIGLDLVDVIFLALACVLMIKLLLLTAVFVLVVMVVVVVVVVAAAPIVLLLAFSSLPLVDEVFWAFKALLGRRGAAEDDVGALIVLLVLVIIVVVELDVVVEAMVDGFCCWRWWDMIPLSACGSC